VILLNGAKTGLRERQGHTELSLALMKMAGLAPCSTVCEMLDSTTGRALDKIRASEYARQRGFTFINGADVIQAWKISEDAFLK
jgi:3,4-dihydroxy 2-butanone 4-phosphate synthase